MALLLSQLRDVVPQDHQQTRRSHYLLRANPYLLVVAVIWVSEFSVKRSILATNVPSARLVFKCKSVAEANHSDDENDAKCLSLVEMTVLSVTLYIEVLVISVSK